jgi:hypothetical protein
MAEAEEFGGDVGQSLRPASRGRADNSAAERRLEWVTINGDRPF